MKTPSHLRKGFTLIELIVVIAILVTLASIAIPGVMGALNTANNTAARKVCIDITQAATRFAQDNNSSLPYYADDAKADHDDQIFLTTEAGKDANMIAILTNREEDDDNRMNTTHDTYLKADEQEQRLNGLYVDPADGSLNYYDPWGSPYYVVLCEEEKGCIDPFTTKRLRGKQCLVYSLGADKAGAAAKSSSKGKKGKKAKTSEADEEAIEDNVYSWKQTK